jgi:hypothetical protein
MPARNRFLMSLPLEQFLSPSFCEYSRFKILNQVLCSRSVGAKFLLGYYALIRGPQARE